MKATKEIKENKAHKANKAYMVFKVRTDVMDNKGVKENRVFRG